MNEAEAARVRALFDLYLEFRSLIAVVSEVRSRGRTTKSWATKADRVVPPRPMTRDYISHLLRNPAYVGKVRFDGATFPAEHAPLVEPDTFARVQELLTHNATTGGRDVRDNHHMLLTGLIRCASCERPMLPTYTKRTNRLYRYYVCRRTREEGWDVCATKSVAAEEIEHIVAEQIRAIGRDPEVFEATLTAARARASGSRVDAEDLRRALGLWDDVWGALTPREQTRVMALLVEDVAYDGATRSAALTFRPSGIRALAKEATR